MVRFIKINWHENEYKFFETTVPLVYQSSWFKVKLRAFIDIYRQITCINRFNLSLYFILLYSNKKIACVFIIYTLTKYSIVTTEWMTNDEQQQTRAHRHIGHESMIRNACLLTNCFYMALFSQLRKVIPIFRHSK